MAETAAHAAQEKLATNIAAIDVSDVLAITEVFVLASADNERQVGSIVDEVEDEMTKQGFEPQRREGNRENRWVLLDYGNIVVHVQRNDQREFYGLDRLYHDCPALEIEGIEAPERPANGPMALTRAKSIPSMSSHWPIRSLVRTRSFKPA